MVLKSEEKNIYMEFQNMKVNIYMVENGMENSMI